MKASDQRSGWFYLVAFWGRMLVVSAVALLLYVELGGLVWDTLLDLPWMNRIGTALNGSWLERMVLTLGGILVWWRIVKVFVLHGALLPWGLRISDGRAENGGRSGRPVTAVWIGDMNVHVGKYEGKFWYGAIFRAHPSSDKLMRSRLELIVLALPFGWSLSVHESRLFLQHSGHESRAKQYRLVSDKYTPKRESPSLNSYRTEVLRHLRSVGGYFDRKRNVKRIEGLDWHFMAGGEGYIRDDFGYQITFEQTEDGKYKVTQLGPNADREEVVDGVEAVIQLAREELTGVCARSCRNPPFADCD